MRRDDRACDVDDVDAAFVVISMRAALSTDAAYHRLRRQPPQDGGAARETDRVEAPARLDLGTIAPEEIAMSFLAEITIERRRGQKGRTEGAGI